MEPINWPQLLRALLADGMTQPEIAKACDCGQSTISDMLRGKTNDPRTSLGLRLLALGGVRRVHVPVVFQPCKDANAAPAADRAEAQRAA